MIKVYGASTCRFTRDLRLNLDNYHIPYEFCDINSSLSALKEFVLLRDKADCFKRQKEIGGIGIPVIVDGDIITNKWTTYLNKLGIEKILSSTEECVDKNC